MNPTIAIRMVGADFLKLRKKRSTLIWAVPQRGVIFLNCVTGVGNSCPAQWFMIPLRDESETGVSNILRADVQQEAGA